MYLDGLHHITAITGDAPRNVDFYARVLGLRLVKKTVNQDDPSVYHLFYADENGSPGADLTFFEYPGLPPGQAGAGMVHSIAHRVRSAEALDYWLDRLGSEGVAAARDGDRVQFADPEGLVHELVVDQSGDPPLIARHREVPAEFALQGFDGVRAYSARPESSQSLLEDVLGFTSRAEGWELRGEHRGSTLVYDPPPGRGLNGAGTVHHIAWSSPLDQIEDWRERVGKSGMQPTPVIDRFYFRSVYFREPSGVLFELATQGPGFTSDEPAETLGEGLSLPPNFEHVRTKVEQILTPLPDVTAWRPE